MCCSCWLDTILVLSIDFVARNRVNNLLRANFLYVVVLSDGMNVDVLLWVLLMPMLEVEVEVEERSAFNII